MSDSNEGMFERISSGEFKVQLPYPDLNSEEARREYRQEIYRVEQRFREAAMQAVGLAGEPPAVQELCWIDAWEEGHSSGWSEIYIELMDWAERLAALKGLYKVEEQSPEVKEISDAFYALPRGERPKALALVVALLKVCAGS